jgi:glycosyltransferase involved in cell wall biosynthesis/SAM-dependent methyltransferase
MPLLPQLTPTYIAPSAWWEHVPIAHWLIAELKPQTVVELGTHYGVSFFAFCQASKQFGESSYIYAIDTWEGDEHAGQYGDEIYIKVLAHQRMHYGQISSLLRQTFDEAVSYFGDESIDLLHIDGLHSYEAVRHDYETWLPKLKKGGTILFHDINVRERDFGVWELWQQLKDNPQFSCLEVLNGSGLGIATIATEMPDWQCEFQENQKLFRSSGALYLELAIKHLSMQEAQAQNAILLAQVDALKRHTTTEPDANEESAVIEEAVAIEKTIEIRDQGIEPNGAKPSSLHILNSPKNKIRTSFSRQRYRLQSIIYKIANKTGILRKRTTENIPGHHQLFVICISGEPHTPGHRYRVRRLADAFKAIGARVTILGPKDIVNHLREIEKCDILSLWRIAWSTDLDAAVSACKLKDGKILFDVDDLMIRPELAKAKIIDGIRSNSFDEDKTAELFARMQHTMLAADLCVTTTYELATQMRLYGKPVMILANGYDEETYAASRLAFRKRELSGQSDVLRIGYASGSLTHQKDFQCCYEAVANILHLNKRCRLVLFHDDNNTPCLDIREFPLLEAVSDQIEWRRLVPIEDLPHELARFDINIIPLETGNVFTESKSELKFFEAALVGTCSVASPTGPFRRIIRSGETGFLASSTQEWEDQLQCLISNPELRKRFSTSALADTLFAYGPLRRTQQISKLAAYATNPSLRPLVFQSILQEEISQEPNPTVDLPEHDIVLAHDRLKTSTTTVVIPLYNYSQYIEETLDSVKKQTLADIDVIVVNDQSTDNSLAKARAWLERNHQHFNRILLVNNRINSKLGPCRNVGFHLAESDYIFTLDADNRLAPRCLEHCLAAARQSKAAYIYPTLQEFGASNGQIGGLEYTPIKFISGNYIDAMAMVAKAAWQKVGGYRNIRHGWEDYDLWCRMAEAGLNAHHLPGEPLAFYRVHGQSMLRTTTDEAKNKKALIRNLESMHPWLHISTPPQEETKESSPPSLASEAHASPATKPERSGEGNRLDTLLPILRCPSSHRQLMFSGDRLWVEGEPGSSWPLLRGVPNLFTGLTSPEIKDGEHISHPLPNHILEKIKATPGQVLNLSAGGSAEKMANIVEVEFALFRHTDIIADAHALPFVDECFDGIISMNAFEHYHSPNQVAAELLRVLRPGGWLVVQTAFMQPEHEYPWHFYNATSEGIKLWFQNFNIDDIRISENFNPIYALSWLAAECESAIRSDVSAKAADQLRSTAMKSFIDHWRQGKIKDLDPWENFRHLSQSSQRPIAAGFELIATKPFAHDGSSQP